MPGSWARDLWMLKPPSSYSAAPCPVPASWLSPPGLVMGSRGPCHFTQRYGAVEMSIVLGVRTFCFLGVKVLMRLRHAAPFPVHVGQHQAPCSLVAAAPCPPQASLWPPLGPAPRGLTVWELLRAAGLPRSGCLISLLQSIDQILALQKSMKVFTLAFSGTVVIVLIQMH